MMPTITLSTSYLIMAFRSALGRQSYVTGMVADELIAQADNLENWQRIQVVNDIRQALKNGTAGAPRDRQNWRRVAEVFEGIPT